MVQTDVEIKPHKITCIICGNRHEAKLESLKFRSNMEPFKCELCRKGVSMGNIRKLEKFILENYDIKTTIVDFIINELKQSKK